MFFSPPSPRSTVLPLFCCCASLCPLTRQLPPSCATEGTLRVAFLAKNRLQGSALCSTLKSPQLRLQGRREKQALADFLQVFLRLCSAGSATPSLVDLAAEVTLPSRVADPFFVQDGTALFSLIGILLYRLVFYALFCVSFLCRATVVATALGSTAVAVSARPPRACLVSVLAPRGLSSSVSLVSVSFLPLSLGAWVALQRAGRQTSPASLLTRAAAVSSLSLSGFFKTEFRVLPLSPLSPSSSLAAALPPPAGSGLARRFAGAVCGSRRDGAAEENRGKNAASATRDGDNPPRPASASGLRSLLLPSCWKLRNAQPKQRPASPSVSLHLASSRPASSDAEDCAPRGRAVCSLFASVLRRRCLLFFALACLGPLSLLLLPRARLSRPAAPLLGSLQAAWHRGMGAAQETLWGGDRRHWAAVWGRDARQATAGGEGGRERREEARERARASAAEKEEAAAEGGLATRREKEMKHGDIAEGNDGNRRRLDDAGRVQAPQSRSLEREARGGQTHEREASLQQEMQNERALPQTSLRRLEPTSHDPHTGRTATAEGGADAASPNEEKRFEPRQKTREREGKSDQGAGRQDVETEEDRVSGAQTWHLKQLRLRTAYLSTLALRRAHEAPASDSAASSPASSPPASPPSTSPSLPAASSSHSPSSSSLSATAEPPLLVLPFALRRGGHRISAAVCSSPSPWLVAQSLPQRPLGCLVFLETPAGSKAVAPRASLASLPSSLPAESPPLADPLSDSWPLSSAAERAPWVSFRALARQFRREGEDGVRRLWFHKYAVDFEEFYANAPLSVLFLRFLLDHPRSLSAALVAGSASALVASRRALSRALLHFLLSSSLWHSYSVWAPLLHQQAPLPMLLLLGRFLYTASKAAGRSLEAFLWERLADLEAALLERCATVNLCATAAEGCDARQTETETQGNAPPHPGRQP
ncbi:hypothetical protein BESB_000490 [Besnoitia besnoiti]|uniref:Transmembrane protein n=1 Tax=Besnoitia besnoiti TaxID=94643 RepID=A0A2A9MP09_BESBE|nr:hypothetical protein BESB_000490 [Besnoitia besnoiti]PFH37707.1 hypothetical protein BESB_000490 [Besnoitia besnoiti]